MYVESENKNIISVYKSRITRKRFWDWFRNLFSFAVSELNRELEFKINFDFWLKIIKIDIKISFIFEENIKLMRF